jgi:hypothetical protein
MNVNPRKVTIYKLKPAEPYYKALSRHHHSTGIAIPVCGRCGAHGYRGTCEGQWLEPVCTEETLEVVEGGGEPPMEVVVVVVPFWPEATTVN